ncbi:TPA: GntR family transcriptional regulator, partial [Escherichia coli]
MPGTEKIPHISLTMKVENDLKHQLSIGALKPGVRLITKNLAEQLGMSITPVREALLRLVSVNALSVAPAQAFTVPEVGKRQLDEINRIRYELELGKRQLDEINRIRYELELMAVTLAVENLTPQDLAELEELLEKLQQAQEKGDMEQIVNANRLFRLAIYHRSNMPILCEMIEQLWVRMGPGLHYLYEAINPAELRERIENYRLLLAALKAKDKEGCRHCLAEIMQQNIAILYQQYN